MTALRDLTGQRFGRLTVAGRAVDPRKNTRWQCKCDCGQSTVVVSGQLTSGGTQSCGCLRRELMTKHGMAQSSEWFTWQNIRARCNRPTAVNYEYYGGRGIQVCASWEESFENFISDMGTKPTAEHTIERIDNNGHYEPSNCRWALMTEQSNNKRPFGSVRTNWKNK